MIASYPPLPPPIIPLFPIALLLIPTATWIQLLPNGFRSWVNSRFLFPSFSRHMLIFLLYSFLIFSMHRVRITIHVIFFLMNWRSWIGCFYDLQFEDRVLDWDRLFSKFVCIGIGIGIGICWLQELLSRHFLFSLFYGCVSIPYMFNAFKGSKHFHNCWSIQFS